VVFGAAALLLDRKFAQRMGGRTTNDIDIIIPTERELKLNADREFWQALQATNRELEPMGRGDAQDVADVRQHAAPSSRRDRHRK